MFSHDSSGCFGGAGCASVCDECQIFNWLRDERYTPKLDVAGEDAESAFLPVEIEAATSPVPALAPVPPRQIEIEFPDGCRVSAEGSFDIDVLARLLKGLSS